MAERALRPPRAVRPASRVHRQRRRDRPHRCHRHHHPAGRHRDHLHLRGRRRPRQREHRQLQAHRHRQRRRTLVRPLGSATGTAARTATHRVHRRPPRPRRPPRQLRADDDRRHRALPRQGRRPGHEGERGRRAPLHRQPDQREIGGDPRVHPATVQTDRERGHEEVPLRRHRQAPARPLRAARADIDHALHRPGAVGLVSAGATVRDGGGRLQARAATEDGRRHLPLVCAAAAHARDALRPQVAILGDWGAGVVPADVKAICEAEVKAEWDRSTQRLRVDPDTGEQLVSASPFDLSRNRRPRSTGTPSRSRAPAAWSCADGARLQGRAREPFRPSPRRPRARVPPRSQRRRRASPPGKPRASQTAYRISAIMRPGRCR